MKKILVILVSIGLLCISMSQSVFSLQTSKNQTVDKKMVGSNQIIQKENYFSLKTIERTYSDDFGVWVHTKYNGQEDSQKLEIDPVTFKLMLDGGGWRYYSMNFGSGQSTAGLQFSRTQIYVEDEPEPYVDVVQTQFSFETTSDTVEDYEVSLEVRFPFSLLEKKVKSFSLFENLLNNFIKNIRYDFLKNIFEKILNRNNGKTDDIDALNSEGESYFCARIGFASPQGDQGPRRVETRFFFGRNSIWDPRVFRMKITPYDLGGEYKLSYFNSYLTISESGSEAFYRVFSVDFEPAAELQITSIPKKAEIGYSFGSSAGTTTKISFSAEGGSLSNIVQSFLIDPLPSYMAFDLTVLGERSFKYESDSQYSVTYMVDSVQDGNLVMLELTDLPKSVVASWGLSIKLSALLASGFIDLDMSSDIGGASVYLYGNLKPFITLANFPKKLRLAGSLDVSNLNGYISADIGSDATTTISVPFTYDKWEITGTLLINQGYGKLSFDLPSSGSSNYLIGLDTNDNPLFGAELSVVDTSTSKRAVYFSVGGVGTNDFLISFDGAGGQISNLAWSGGITKILDLYAVVDYQGLNFDMTGSWDLGDEGSLTIKVNKAVDLNLDDIEASGFKLRGSISLNPGSFFEISWERGSTGHFMIRTYDISAEAEVTFGDKHSSNVYFYAKVVIDPNCVLNFEWEWGPVGRVMVFTKLFKELIFEVGYNYNSAENEYQYGLRAQATDVSFTRTLQWDTVNGFRFWWLGDTPLPSSWDVDLLWNYEWRDVL